MRIYCPKCEQSCHELSVICPTCGHRLASSSAPAAEPSPPWDVRCPKCGNRCEEPFTTCYACGYRPASPPSSPASEAPRGDAACAAVREREKTVDAVERERAACQDLTTSDVGAAPGKPLPREHWRLRCCMVCGGPVAPYAQRCPHCGGNPSLYWLNAMRRIVPAIIALALLVAAVDLSAGPAGIICAIGAAWFGWLAFRN